jgi:hypothetical protein
MKDELVCGRCGRRVSEIRGVCDLSGQNADEVRAEIEHRVTPLLRLHAALTMSTHIYANYERTLVEQELKRHGVNV